MVKAKAIQTYVIILYYDLLQVCALKKTEADVGDVMKKVKLNGADGEPLFKYLKMKQRGIFGRYIKWNFTKFLIDKNGQPVDRFAPTTNIMNHSKQIEELLQA